MFKRVILEDWSLVVPYICFGLIAGSFLLIVVWAFRMKKPDAEKLAAMPLQDFNEPTTKEVNEK